MCFTKAVVLLQDVQVRLASRFLNLPLWFSGFLVKFKKKRISQSDSPQN